MLSSARGSMQYNTFVCKTIYHGMLVRGNVQSGFNIACLTVTVRDAHQKSHEVQQLPVHLGVTAASAKQE